MTQVRQFRLSGCSVFGLGGRPRRFGGVVSPVNEAVGLAPGLKLARAGEEGDGGILGDGVLALTTAPFQLDADKSGAVMGPGLLHDDAASPGVPMAPVHPSSIDDDAFHGCALCCPLSTRDA